MTIKLSASQEALLRDLAGGRRRGATPSFKPRQSLVSYGLVEESPSLVRDPFGLRITASGWVWLKANRETAD